MSKLKHLKKFNESRIKERLDKIEKMKNHYGSGSSQYIEIALKEITDILREYFKVDEIK